MKSMNIHVLMIEDNEFDALLIQHQLLHGLKKQIKLTQVKSLTEAFTLIDQQHFDLILSDLNLPDSAGVDTVIKLKKATDTPVAVLTISKDEKLAIQCINAGAQDYLEKDVLSESSLIRLVRYSIERRRAEERTQKISRRYQAIFEKAPLGIAHIDFENGAFIDLNPRYAHIVGRKITELMQLKQSDLMHPNDVESYAKDTAYLKNNKPSNPSG